MSYIAALLCCVPRCEFISPDSLAMPPRRRRLAPQPASPPPAPAAAVPDPASPALPRQPAKRRTIADNAKEISDMRGQLTSMSELLYSISDRITAGTAPTAPAHEAPPAASPYEPSPAAATDPLQPPTRQCHKARHHSTGQFSHPPSSQPWLAQPQGRRQDHVRLVDPLASLQHRHHYRESAAPYYDSDDNDDIHTRVAHLLTSHLAPLGTSQGKKQFAHFYVRRGSKRSKTTLGELSVPEYNFGFMSLIDSPDTFDADKPHMFRHLANLNEDASSYEWPWVRFWSEEICALVAGGKLSWDDDYKIDLLRLKFAQQNKLSSTKDTPYSDPKGIDFHTELSPEVRAAKPGPPCRPFNTGSCSFTHHHVQNGYRRLHVCSHCVSQKCLLLPHSVDKCKSKVFTTAPRPQRPKEDPGFGK